MHSIPLEQIATLIRGATDTEWHDRSLSPLRLPRWTRSRQADQWIELWSAQTLGVRLVARTSASVLELSARITRILPPDATTPPFLASVVATIDGAVVATAMVEDGPLIRTRPDRTAENCEGPDSLLRLELGHSVAEREVTVWLPHNAQTRILELRSDAPLLVPKPDSRPRWVHHGSSVSHGLEASSPLGPWPQQVARALDLDLTNLSIAGNAQLDPFVARTIAARPADIITLKLGVNTINVDSMRRRAFIPALHEFLDLVREGHPALPVVVITPIGCPAIEHTPGPTRKLADGRYHGTPREIVPGDGTLTLGVVREIVRDVVLDRHKTDPNLWFADGLELLGLADEGMLWDGLHPDQSGYDLIASRFVERAEDPLTGIGRGFESVLAGVHGQP